jgi:hypothetical protein
MDPSPDTRPYAAMSKASRMDMIADQIEGLTHVADRRDPALQPRPQLLATAI